MRIIAGKHKNRVIPTSKNADYRPSTTKFREALFSILSSGDFAENEPVKNANILDLFSGAGSLSFEALSRGAKSATLIDNKLEYLRSAKKFAEKIGEEDNVNVLAASAISLPDANNQYSLVFMDPPYHKNYAQKSLRSLHRQNWLNDGAIIAIEISKYDKLEINNEYSLIKEKLYGNNRLLIIKYSK